MEEGGVDWGIQEGRGLGGMGGGVEWGGGGGDEREIDHSKPP